MESTKRFKVDVTHIFSNFYDSLEEARRLDKTHRDGTNRAVNADLDVVDSFTCGVYSAKSWSGPSF